MAHSLYETSLQDHGSCILENNYPVTTTMIPCKQVLWRELALWYL